MTNCALKRTAIAIGAAISVAVLLIANQCGAEPMMAPSLEEAADSRWILLVSYEDYKQSQAGTVSYFGNVLADYNVIRALKGTAPSHKRITVGYSFHDGSACLPLKGWRFSPESMPKKRSQWILFLEAVGQFDVPAEHKPVEVFSTYRGDFGRIPASEENLRKIESLLHSPKNQ